jgi:carbonic anhydrase
LHQKELDAIKDTDARYRRLIELNVQEQCVNVIKTAVVQKTYLRTGHPTVHGWVYDISNGLLRDLEIPFGKILERIQEIYRLEAT